MKIVDIANEIYMELGSPSDLSIPPIAFWLRTNIGFLNSKINSDYLVDEVDFEIKETNNGITSEIGIEESYILKKLYLIHFYDVKLRESLGAASVDTWVEIESDGTSVRRVNKIQQSQTYQVAKKTEMEDLDKLIHSYKNKRSKPTQVVGDDTIAGNYWSDSESNRGN